MVNSKISIAKAMRLTEKLKHMGIINFIKVSFNLLISLAFETANEIRNKNKDRCLFIPS